MRYLRPSCRALPALLVLAALVLLPASVLCAAESTPEGPYCPLMAAGACPMEALAAGSGGAAGFEPAATSCCLAPEAPPPAAPLDLSPQVVPAVAALPQQTPVGIADVFRPRALAVPEPLPPPAGGLYTLHAAFLI